MLGGKRGQWTSLQGGAQAVHGGQCPPVPQSDYGPVSTHPYTLATTAALVI